MSQSIKKRSIKKELFSLHHEKGGNQIIII